MVELGYYLSIKRHSIDIVSVLKAVDTIGNYSK